MYKQQFDTILKNGLQQSSFMFHGESEYFIDSYTALVSAQLLPDTVVKMYQEDYSFETAKATLSQGSLFGDKNLLIYKGEKELAKEELKTLLGICAKNENSYFIYALYSAKKRASAALFNAKNSGCEVRFFHPKLSQALHELQLRAKELDIDINRYTLEHLYMVLNMDLTLAINELQKLALLDSSVTNKDIDNLVYATSSIKVETLFYDLMDKKPVIEHLTQLLQSGEDSFKLLRQIQYFFQQLFMFRSYITLKGTIDSKEILGYKLPDFIEKQKASYAKRLKILQYSTIFKRLLEAEMELKKADSLQKEPILIATILSLQAYL